VVRGLERDNSRAYFTAHRDVYENATCARRWRTCSCSSGDFGRDVTVFRQHRDVRFSKDKSPYKTRTYGVLRPPVGAAGFYAEVSRTGLFAGTGYYQLAARPARALPRGRARDGREVAGIVERLEAEDFEVFGEALKTAPRGFPRDHEHARLLRHKSLFCGRRLAPWTPRHPRRRRARAPDDDRGGRPNPSRPGSTPTWAMSTLPPTSASAGGDSAGARVASDWPTAGVCA
jgi:uncharacterized protein (TIGR02453 family)